MFSNIFLQNRHQGVRRVTAVSGGTNVASARGRYLFLISTHEGAKLLGNGRACRWLLACLSFMSLFLVRFNWARCLVLTYLFTTQWKPWIRCKHNTNMQRVMVWQGQWKGRRYVPWQMQQALLHSVGRSCRNDFVS